VKSDHEEEDDQMGGCMDGDQEDHQEQEEENQEHQGDNQEQEEEDQEAIQEQVERKRLSRFLIRCRHFKRHEVAAMSMEELQETFEKEKEEEGRERARQKRQKDGRPINDPDSQSWDAHGNAYVNEQYISKLKFKPRQNDGERTRRVGFSKGTPVMHVYSPQENDEEDQAQEEEEQQACEPSPSDSSSSDFSSDESLSHKNDKTFVPNHNHVDSQDSNKESWSDFVENELKLAEARERAARNQKKKKVNN